MSFKGNKIATFKKYLDEGKSKEEAMKLAGIKKNTAQINYRKWQKEKGEVQVEEPQIEVEE